VIKGGVVFGEKYSALVVSRNVVLPEFVLIELDRCYRARASAGISKAGTFVPTSPMNSTSEPIDALQGEDCRMAALQGQEFRLNALQGLDGGILGQVRVWMAPERS
jgi:hypothetical protein